MSNAGLIVGATRSLLVETFSDLAHTRRMLSAIHDAAPSAGDIGVVVNTHSDPDHCWGNQLLADRAEIIASRAAAEAMLELEPAMLRAVAANAPPGPQAEFAATLFGAFDFSDVVVTPPTRTFEGALTLDVDGLAVELTEVGPAHTAGDVLVHVPAARVVFTGDIVFALAHPLMWRGPVERWIAACDTVLALDPEVVVPGHGPIGGPELVRDVRDYLSYVRDEARGRYDAGMDALEAAWDIDLSAYAGWIDAERIVVNVDSLYRGFGASDERPNQPALIAKMADYRAAQGAR
jgi:glyoxylase-like metal-dependent hydrolase (beta-lactamase superfamily II)